MGISIGAPFLDGLYNRLTRYIWQPLPPGPTLDVDIRTEKGSYRDKQSGRDTPIPEPGTPERVWWDNAMEFFENNYNDMIDLTNWWDTMSNPTLSTDPTQSPLIPVNQPRIPDGAEACTYMDEASGTTKPGYKISKGADNYEIYDRWNHQLVQRTHNGITEVGKFEYSFVLNSDGTIGLDMEHPGALVEGKIYYNATDGGKAQFGVAEKNVQEVRLEVPSDSIKPDPGYTIDPVTNKILNGILHLPNLWLDITIDNGKVEDSNGDGVGSGEFGPGKVNYYVAPGVNNDIPENTDAMSTIRFREFLAARQVNLNDIYLVSMFENVPAPWCDFPEDIRWLPDFGAWFADALEWNAGVSAPLPIPADVAQKISPLVLQALIDVGWIEKKNGELLLKTDVTIKEYLTRKMLDRLRAQYNKANHRGDDKNIAVTYSGTTNPMLKALVQAQAEGNPLNIDTLISWAGPIINKCTAEEFAQTSLTTFINCWGSKDQLADWFGKMGELGKALDSDLSDQSRPAFGKQLDLSSKCKTINIEIKDAKHDYFYYDATEWTKKLWDVFRDLNIVFPSDPYNYIHIVQVANILREMEANRKTASFMADLAKAAQNQRDLADFYDQDFFVEKDPASNYYKVDLDLYLG